MSFAHAVHVALIYEEWELPGCEESHVAIVVDVPSAAGAPVRLVQAAEVGAYTRPFVSST